jgi:hypothetical protein
MNIVEAYLKYIGELVIIISGLSGSGKTTIAKLIERDFKLKLINLDNFTNEEYNEKVTLPSGLTVIDWDNVDAFDWDKLNAEVAKNKQNGVVICGPYFPKDKLQFNSHMHIQIKIPKQILIANRTKYITENTDKFKDIDVIDDAVVGTIVNKITYPHFLHYSKLSDIDKYINSDQLTKDDVYNQSADFLFFRISAGLKEHDLNKQQRDPANTTRSNKPANQKLLQEINYANDKDDSDAIDIDDSSSTSCPMNGPVFVGSEERDWNYKWNY